mgnify:CR=1 FL=1
MRKVILAALVGAAMWGGAAQAAVRLEVRGIGTATHFDPFGPRFWSDLVLVTIATNCTQVLQCVNDSGGFNVHGMSSGGSGFQISGQFAVTPAADGAWHAIAGSAAFNTSCGGLVNCRAENFGLYEARLLTVTGPVGDVVTVQPVPEPATWGMMIAGFAMLGWLMRRKHIHRPTFA